MQAPLRRGDDAEDHRRPAIFALELHTAEQPAALREWAARVAPGLSAPPLLAADADEASAFVAAVLGATARDLTAVRRALDILVACVAKAPVSSACDPPVSHTLAASAIDTNSVAKPITAEENWSGGNALRAVRERRLYQQHQHQQPQPRETQADVLSEDKTPLQVDARLFELPASAVPATALCLSFDGDAFTPAASADFQPDSAATSVRVGSCVLTEAAVGGLDLDASGDAGDLNQYAVLQQLGRGAQGTVFLALDTVKNELRALKAVERPPPGARMSPAKRKAQEDLAREVAIMKRLRHRN
eukprot:CAMPEP_0174837988 /NCGR_PEP_ID=MMETSP1114-20130205/7113_1 /TAXON_ID=312471 /ORGANISM="Neobodo designis, Strain CCAP 1951/1" /LENGTH=302 /DNA_ID=CAMNT_0016072077 /DNA_START=228 /DNA_END=1133 /DNA_ORIENTATION=+